MPPGTAPSRTTQPPRPPRAPREACVSPNPSARAQRHRSKRNEKYAGGVVFIPTYSIHSQSGCQNLQQTQATRRGYLFATATLHRNACEHMAPDLRWSCLPRLQPPALRPRLQRARTTPSTIAHPSPGNALISIRGLKIRAAPPRLTPNVEAQRHATACSSSRELRCI